MRRLKLPEAGTVRFRPLKAIDAPLTWAFTGSGVKPPPTSAARVASVAWFAVFNRFVILAGRNTERLPVNTAPGLEPEHCRMMSPIRSVRPSELTWVGTEVTVRSEE